MKLIQFTTLAFTLFSTGVLSHSWAECIDTVVPNKAEKEANPSLMSDKLVLSYFLSQDHNANEYM